MHDLRISVMDRCNFRCPYCMPRETYHENYRFLKTAERLSFDEIVRLARVFARFGVQQVAPDGRRAAAAQRAGRTSSASCRRIDGIEDLALTTNGVLLAQHASELKANGLQRVTVSLDSLDERVFAQMSGGFGGLAAGARRYRRGARRRAAPVKINAVVQRGVNDHTVLDLLERFRGTPVIVRLIEYMDVGNRNDWRPEQVVPSAELLERIQARWPCHRGAGQYRGEVAERYTLRRRCRRDRLHFLGQRAVLR